MMYAQILGIAGAAGFGLAWALVYGAACAIRRPARLRCGAPIRRKVR